MKEKVSRFIESKRNEYFADLAYVIAVNGVNAPTDGKYVFGKNVGETLDRFLELGSKYGFETENLDYYCGRITLKGSGDNERGEFANEFGIVGHADIVPVEAECWSSDPFVLTLKDGMLVGRGTEDDKGPLIAGLYAMRYLKEEYGKYLPFDVSLIIGCNEETGMTDLPYYLEKRKAPFLSVTPDGNFPVCIGEKGITTVEVIIPHCLSKIKSFSGGTVKNAVAGKAEAIVSFEVGENDEIFVDGNTVKAVGVTAHAAMPETGINAIGILAEHLLGSEIEGKERDAMEFLASAAQDYKGVVFGIDAADVPSGYLTCVAGVARTEGDSIVQTFNIRLPVTLSWDDVLLKLRNFCKAKEYELKENGLSEPYYISPGSKEVQTMLKCYRQVTGDMSEPYTIGGGTYAKKFPNTFVYGAVQKKYALLAGVGKGGAHENDEYLSVAEFEDCVKIFVLLILNIAE